MKKRERKLFGREVEVDDFLWEIIKEDEDILWDSVAE